MKQRKKQNYSSYFENNIQNMKNTWHEMAWNQIKNFPKSKC